MNPKQFIIEGIDRLGKTTLINNLLDELGYHLVVHYDKPRKLSFYEKGFEHNVLFSDPLKVYQKAANEQMFKMCQAGVKLICDRGHLGECVYSPLYRNYTGNYVFEVEKQHDTSSTRLVLLTTSDFSICVDDGESFNFDNKEHEQKLFIDAFEQSSIKDKMIVDVAAGDGKFKDPRHILNQVLRRP